MADIRSTAAEIRRGKKEEDRRKKEEGKKLQGKNIMAPYYIQGHQFSYQSKAHMRLPISD